MKKSAASYPRIGVIIGALQAYCDPHDIEVNFDMLLRHSYFLLHLTGQFLDDDIVIGKVCRCTIHQHDMLILPFSMPIFIIVISLQIRIVPFS
jgi:hypothetical protein